MFVVTHRATFLIANAFKKTAVRTLTSDPSTPKIPITVPHNNNGYTYETLLVEQPRPFVFHVQLNRPDKLNAINGPMWTDIGHCFQKLSDDADCRVVVFSGRGRVFTAGLDISSTMTNISGQLNGCDGDLVRRAAILGPQLRDWQGSVSAIELCAKPVLAAVHSVCLGAGVDYLTATDIRYCTRDAWFCVKEVDIGMAADVGTLQRLPKIMGNQSLVRELCLTARKMTSDEASAQGLVSHVFPSHDAMIEHAIRTAELIASKSPVGVQATKKSIVYSTSRTNQEGLDHINEMDKLLLQSEDLAKATMVKAQRKGQPEFAKL